MASIRAEYEGGYVEVSLVSKGVKLVINDNNLKTTLVLEDDLAVEVADNIFTILGLPAYTDIEEQNIKFANQIMDLRDMLEQYEENLQEYKDKLVESCEPF